MGFWNEIDEQLERIRTEKPDTFAQIRSILYDPKYTEILKYAAPYESTKDTFFAGTGGDESVLTALSDAGWIFEKSGAYEATMRHPQTKERLYYCEGDLEKLDPAG